MPGLGLRVQGLGFRVRGLGLFSIHLDSTGLGLLDEGALAFKALNRNVSSRCVTLVITTSVSVIVTLMTMTINHGFMNIILTFFSIFQLLLVRNAVSIATAGWQYQWYYHAAG